MVAITMTGVHCHLTDQAKAHAQEKLSALQRYHPRLGNVHVTVHQTQKKGWRVDVDMHLPTGKDVVAHDEEMSLISAIDVVAGKCATQLRKIHQRETDPVRLRA